VTNVVEFPGQTLLDIPPDKILENAKGQLEQVIIVGVAKETGELYLATSTPEVATNYYNLAVAMQLIMAAYNNED
jgi:hypothetical protein